MKLRVSDTLGFVNSHTQVAGVGNGAVADPDRRSTRWVRHREERRAELVQVATRLIHIDGPDVTMEAIAAASATSKSIIYRYFQDKDELKNAIGESILERMHDRLARAAANDDPIDERMRTMVRTYVETAAKSPNVYVFVVQPSQGLSQFLVSVADLIASTLPASMDESLAHAWSRGAVGFVRSSFQWWTDARQAGHTTMTQDRLTEFISLSLLNGVPK